MTEKLLQIANEAEAALAGIFADIDAVSMQNTARVLDAFRDHRVSDAHFAPSSGYGYDDKGRDTLDRIYADVFGAEAAFVRHSIASGTHALAIGLYALLRPGDLLYSVADKPYDTLDEVIGNVGEAGRGSLRDFGVEYMQSDLKDGKLNFAEIKANLEKYGDRIKVVFVQRSKGYLNRPTLTVAEIGELCEMVHAVSNAYVVVDNCYGEFTEDREPTAVGADMIIGSLIKNPGGGMAEIRRLHRRDGNVLWSCAALPADLPSASAPRSAHPSGRPRACTAGFFYAPHTVAQALKTACTLRQRVFEDARL